MNNNLTTLYIVRYGESIWDIINDKNGTYDPNIYGEYEAGLSENGIK